ncbi:MAG: hypothetical protein IID51_14305 [Proteobacteria bacterium]|nr:hypothetical protein [Pseudomonadota bacterium]
MIPRGHGQQVNTALSPRAGLSAVFRAIAGVVWIWQSPTEAALLNSVPSTRLFSLAGYRSR